MSADNWPYDVVRYIPGDALDGQVKLIRCTVCGYSEHTIDNRSSKDRSGLTRYNRMREKIIRHVKDVHYFDGFKWV